MNLAVKMGKIIRTARINAGKTQLEVADELGFENAQFVSLMERGHSKIPRSVLKKLIKILELNRAEMLNLILADFTKTLQSEI